MTHLFYFKRKTRIQIGVTLTYIGGLFFLVYYQPVVLLALLLLFFMIIGLNLLVCEWRTCYLVYHKMPALEVGATCFIDHRLKLKIPWDEVVEVELKHFKSGYYGIVYQVREERVIKKQLQKPYQKWLCGVIGVKRYSTLHLYRINANKYELFERMEQYQKKAPKRV
ncbi:hypothetical protein [Myroides fluvii]|uniref:hypothetical protein n=1 Tax=Myroides fluvii TaxID=2572594 RepID=UPI00131BB996|nr:hypothetical protein [Myroides fluvii]